VKIIFTLDARARWQHNILSAVQETDRLISFAAFTIRDDLDHSTMAEFSSMAPLHINHKVVKNEPLAPSESPCTPAPSPLDSEFHPSVEPRPDRKLRRRRNGNGV
jgi:hypothetical protein